MPAGSPGAAENRTVSSPLEKVASAAVLPFSPQLASSPVEYLDLVPVPMRAPRGLFDSMGSAGSPTLAPMRGPFGSSSSHQLSFHSLGNSRDRMTLTGSRAHLTSPVPTSAVSSRAPSPAGAVESPVPLPATPELPFYIAHREQVIRPVVGRDPAAADSAAAAAPASAPDNLAALPPLTTHMAHRIRLGAGGKMDTIPLQPDAALEAVPSLREKAFMKGGGFARISPAPQPELPAGTFGLSDLPLPAAVSFPRPIRTTGAEVYSAAAPAAAAAATPPVDAKPSVPRPLAGHLPPLVHATSAPASRSKPVAAPVVPTQSAEEIIAAELVRRAAVAETGSPKRSQSRVRFDLTPGEPEPTPPKPAAAAASPQQPTPSRQVQLPSGALASPPLGSAPLPLRYAAMSALPQLHAGVFRDIRGATAGVLTLERPSASEQAAPAEAVASVVEAVQVEAVRVPRSQLPRYMAESVPLVPSVNVMSGIVSGDAVDLQQPALALAQHLQLPRGPLLGGSGGGGAGGLGGCRYTLSASSPTPFSLRAVTPDPAMAAMMPVPSFADDRRVPAPDYVQRARDSPLKLRSPPLPARLKPETAMPPPMVLHTPASQPPVGAGFTATRSLVRGPLRTELPARKASRLARAAVTGMSLDSAQRTLVRSLYQSP
jgi:hypothetical protein